MLPYFMQKNSDHSALVGFIFDCLIGDVKTRVICRVGPLCNGFCNPLVDISKRGAPAAIHLMSLLKNWGYMCTHKVHYYYKHIGKICSIP